MNEVITIELKKLRFFGFHGVHEGERKTGNEFEVNVTIEYSPGKRISSIDDTINYVSVYEIIKEEMQQPRQLLETVAMDIADKLKKFNAERISVQIIKLTAPICNFSGSVGVSYIWSSKERL